MNKVSDYCTGCFACASVCPKQCISLKPDEYGEIVPEIVQNSCVNCGACVRVCPTNFPIKGSKPEEVYATISKNIEIYQNSTSGGVSMEIAKAILSIGGVVYGTGMDGIEATVMRVTSEEDLKLIQGSKYVHSHMNNAMRLMQKDLEMGKQVVFFGVPCQIAGVRCFFKQRPEGLYLVDILCHGAPTQDCFRQGISLETTESVINVKFRDNTRYCLSLMSASGEVLKVPYRRSYWFNGFVEGYIMRDACYSCCYANTDRMGDVTLGDFWGLDKNIQFEHPYGVNILLINTSVGKKLWKLIQKNVCYEKRELEDALPYNHSLNHPALKSEEYKTFREMYAKYGGAYALKKAFKKKTRYITARRWLAGHKMLYSIVIKIPKIGNKLKDYPN